MPLVKGNVSYAGPGNGVSISWSHTVAAKSNILIVCVSHGCDVSGHSGSFAVTYNGASMTQYALVESLYAGYYFYAVMFYLVNPDTGSHTVQVTGNYGGQFGHGETGAIDFAGALTASPFRTESENQSLLISPVSDIGDYVIDCLTAYNVSAAGGTPDAGQTELFDAPFYYEHVASYKVGEHTNTPMNWTLTGSEYAHVAGALRPATLRRGGIFIAGA